MLRHRLDLGDGLVNPAATEVEQAEAQRREQPVEPEAKLVRTPLSLFPIFPAARLVAP